MKKRLTRVMSVMLFTVLILAFGAFADDATPLYTDGGTASGSFEASYNTLYDNYELNVTDAGKLTLDVSCSEKIGLDLFADSTESNTHTRTDDVEKGEITKNIELIPGKYILQVFNCTGETTNYTIKTSFSKANETYTRNDDTINIIRNGEALPFNTAITGQLAWRDTLDYYKITLPSSGRLKIDVHSYFETLSSNLYKDDNNKVTGFDDMGIGDRVSGVDLKAGTYYLCFENGSDAIFGGPGTGTGVYEFTLGFTPSGETYTKDNETVNLIRSSKGIPLNKTITGHLAINDEYDYYKLVIPASGNYSMKINSKFNISGFELLDSKENRVASGGHDRGTKTYKYQLKAGTYYLGFNKSYSNDTGTYKFKVSMSVPKPAVKSVSKRKHSITVKWNKRSGVTGYQIQYALNGSAKSKIVTIKRASASSKKIKSLKSKRRYTVRIRSYKTVKGKRYYSAWSAKKIVRTN